MCHVLNQINKAGITLLSNEDYLHIFHEIKNSITLINSSLQLVEKKHPEVREFDYWSESMSELCFLKNMVIQLSSARLCNQLNLMQVSIYSFMHQIDTSIRVLSWKDFVCNFQLDENLPLIELDPQLLKQAVINIIKNAFEAMHESGTTDIHVFYEEPWMNIAITDHGGGLDPALADTIFQPFITSKTGGRSGTCHHPSDHRITPRYINLRFQAGQRMHLHHRTSSYAKLNTVSSIRRILKLPFAVISPVINAFWKVERPLVIFCIASEDNRKLISASVVLS